MVGAMMTVKIKYVSEVKVDIPILLIHLDKLIFLTVLYMDTMVEQEQIK